MALLYHSNTSNKILNKREIWSQDPWLSLHIFQKFYPGAKVVLAHPPEFYPGVLIVFTYPPTVLSRSHGGTYIERPPRNWNQSLAQKRGTRWGPAEQCSRINRASSHKNNIKSNNKNRRLEHFSLRSWNIRLHTHSISSFKG